MIVCVQCAMKAMVEGKPSPTFDETWDVHMQHFHPDPIATQQERMDLERLLAEKLKETAP